LSLSGIAVAASLLSGGIALFSARLGRTAAVLSFSLLGVATIAALVAGSVVLVTGATLSYELPLGLPWLPWRVRIDALSGFFLVLIGAVLMAVVAYGPGYVRQFEHGHNSFAVLGGFSGLFIAGMLLVIVADDAFFFMVAWELMSVSSYFLVVFQHENPANRRAAFLYLLMAHVGGLCILLSYGILAGFSGGFAFDMLRTAQVDANWATAAFVLALLGFGMKAGLVPLHVWLPEAHPVAASHISALMSGVMLKVAVYGFVRFTFDLVAEVQWSWGVAVLAVGSFSALLGVLYALMEHDLKRLLAYHSVENIGIIFIGLGLALIFLGTGHRLLGIIALVAALYHTINHALFKSLLFLGAGAILHTCHERDIQQMGGLLQRMPWTGLFFLVGCISISALPPFNGFVSEWLTFQAALQGFVLESGVLRSLLPMAAAMLALTGALAVACFVKVFGVVFLGQARSRQVRHAREVSFGMRAGQAWLAILCLLLGVLPTVMVTLMDAIPRQLLGAGLSQATAHGWLWLTPVSAATASYAAPLVLLAIAVAWWLAAVLLRRGGIRQCDPWDCGFSPPDPRMQYTATAFAQPIRRVFGLLFHIDERVETEAGITRHRLRVDDRSWGLFYEPIIRLVQACARQVARLQSGNARAYLGWSLGTLLVLLWIVS
jgi:formate hydrogenlyase subunit 3/multisubunit Na+/H+ antiporter MnhD subunit